MLFNSIPFLYFLVITLIIYWLLKNNLKFQNIFILISSYFFYGWWDWRFLSLIIFSSFIDFYIGKKIYNSSNLKLRKNWLTISLISNLGLLGVFKYFNFFATSFQTAMQSIGWNVDSITLNIILPVGISFYTFQTLSYTIDVYRNQLKPTNNMVAFFSFISFFPQLVAGPIERASNLLPQMEKSRQYNYALLKAGIFQVFVGLFRKIVIADNLAIYVDSIYNNYGIHNSTTLILATIFYAFQIYFDFSGYSDIAIGTAKLFGFNFNRNFNLPYFSKSITEFWRRWHMSLSFWLRDYLYISLGGNRKGIRITYRNLLLTMILGGLWHGSSWNFIIWGLIHGVALSLEKYIFSKTKLKSFNYLYTFSIVTLAWVFFRTPDLHSAIEFFEIIFKIDFSMPFIGDINSFTVSITMLLIAILFDMWLYNKKVPLEEIGNEFNFRTLVLTTTTIIILLCLFYSTSENFIYFQF